MMTNPNQQRESKDHWLEIYAGLFLRDIQRKRERTISDIRDVAYSFKKLCPCQNDLESTRKWIAEQLSESLRQNGRPVVSVSRVLYLIRKGNESINAIKAVQ